MSAHHQALRDAIKTYLNSNDYRPEYFALHLTKQPSSEKAKLLQAGLKEAIEHGTVSPGNFEDWTDALADSEENVTAFLKALWAYAYEQGPRPELP